MRFTKMHGIGNDYLFVNGFVESVPEPADLSRRISDRHYGVGSDGLILIQPPSSPEADCRMEMYNADGSRGKMCGNGIRCVAKYVHDRGIQRKTELLVETDSGDRRMRLHLGSDSKVNEVEVDMGAPALARRDVPFDDGGDPSNPAVDVPLTVRGREFRITVVSTGNPHAVVRLDRPGVPPIPGFASVGEIALEEWGPEFENHPFFPDRTNTEFITLRSRREMDFRVWERGSGETLACGTGACAAVVAAILNDWCDSDEDVLVHLRGGDLRIRWRRDKGGSVYMTGPAVEVFDGEYPLG